MYFYIIIIIIISSTGRDKHTFGSPGGPSSNKTDIYDAMDFVFIVPSDFRARFTYQIYNILCIRYTYVNVCEVFMFSLSHSPSMCVCVFVCVFLSLSFIYANNDDGFHHDNTYYNRNWLSDWQ